MKSVLRFVLPAAAVACLSASSAFAQQASSDEVSYANNPQRAPAKSFELTLGGGYTQGFGRFGGVAPRINQVAQEGVGADLGIGYRLSPRWGLSLGAEYQEFRAANTLEQTGNPGVRGLAGNFNATFHARPYMTLDPFVTFGSGYRMLWEVPVGAPNVLHHGFELARVTLGADFRMSEDVAIAPIVGADFTAFSFQTANGSTDNPNISNWGLSSFLFAGLQGRFDFGGHRYGSRADYGADELAKR